MSISYTRREWEKLLAKFDAIEERIRKDLEELIEQRKEEEEKWEAQGLACDNIQYI